MHSPAAPCSVQSKLMQLRGAWGSCVASASTVRAHLVDMFGVPCAQWQRVHALDSEAIIWSSDCILPCTARILHLI